MDKTAKTKSDKNLSQNSKHSYFNKFKAALKQAFKDGLIVENYAERVQGFIKEFRKKGISVKFDNRDTFRPGAKFAEYELKGVPVRIAIGARDLENNTVEVARRDTLVKNSVSQDDVVTYVEKLLEDIQTNLFSKAVSYREEHTTEVATFDEFKDAIETRGEGKLPQKTIYLDSITEYPCGDDRQFSTNAVERLDKSGTTMNVALQLAYYMNFDEVYVIGCDSNWITATNTTNTSEGDINHFHPDYHASIGNGEVEFNRMNATHKTAVKYFTEAGKKIYNAAGEPVVNLVKGGAKSDDVHGVDALSGATLTSNGVTRTLQFWFGKEGYAPFIAKYRAANSNGGMN